MARSNRQYFPGMHPTGFLRKNIEDLKRKEYYVSIKVPYRLTIASSSPSDFIYHLFVDISAISFQSLMFCQRDGVRYFLYFARNQDVEGFFIINRKFQVFSCTVPLNADPETLLDSELIITNDKVKSFHFIVFDALYHNGKLAMESQLSTRLDASQRFINSLYRGNNSLPFSMELQRFWPLDQLPMVLLEKSKMKFTDGLIFTPLKLRYHLGYTRDLLKWKPPQENTIDFHLRKVIIQGTPRFQLLKAHKSELVFHDWISGELKELEGLDGKIVECYYDVKCITEVVDPEGFVQERKGGWKVSRIREDKPLPNADRVVDGLILSIQDSVTDQDLLHAVRERREEDQRNHGDNKRSREDQSRGSGGYYNDRRDQGRYQPRRDMEGSWRRKD